MKKNILRVISLALCVSMCAFVTAACGDKSESNDNVGVKSTGVSSTAAETADTAETLDTADVAETIETPEKADEKVKTSSEIEKDKKDNVSSAFSSDTEDVSEIDKSQSSRIVVEDIPMNDYEKSTVVASSDVSVKPLIAEPEQQQEVYDNWIWVGDSRTVGMAGNVGITYLAKSAEGLDWFTTVAHELYDLEGYNIVLNFGINDYWNVLNYANFYNNMPEKVFEKNRVFFMSVNPVDEVKQVSYGYGSSNATLEWFNATLRSNLRSEIEYIDTYTYLQETGFDTIDGIHYEGNTNVKIYNYVVDTVTRNNEIEEEELYYY